MVLFFFFETGHFFQAIPRFRPSLLGSSPPPPRGWAGSQPKFLALAQQSPFGVLKEMCGHGILQKPSSALQNTLPHGRGPLWAPLAPPLRPTLAVLPPVGQTFRTVLGPLEVRCAANDRLRGPAAHERRRAGRVRGVGTGASGRRQRGSTGGGRGGPTARRVRQRDGALPRSGAGLFSSGLCSKDSFNPCVTLGGACFGEVG